MLLRHPIVSPELQPRLKTMMVGSPLLSTFLESGLHISSVERVPWNRRRRSGGYLKECWSARLGCIQAVRILTGGLGPKVNGVSDEVGGIDFVGINLNNCKVLSETVVPGTEHAWRRQHCPPRRCREGVRRYDAILWVGYMPPSGNKAGLRGKAVVSMLGFLGRRNQGGKWRSVRDCVGEGDAKSGQTVLVGSHIENGLKC